MVSVLLFAQPQRRSVSLIKTYRSNSVVFLGGPSHGHCWSKLKGPTRSVTSRLQLASCARRSATKAGSRNSRGPGLIKGRFQLGSRALGKEKGPENSGPFLGTPSASVANSLRPDDSPAARRHDPLPHYTTIAAVGAVIAVGVVRPIPCSGACHAPPATGSRRSAPCTSWPSCG
jgi:hypothetical protein